MTNTNQKVKVLIRSAIEGMVANNQDHDFEKMCYEYASRNICDNAVMPTGGGQGDKGRDFYLIPIYQNGIKSKDIAFLCSLNKKIDNKIKADIAKVYNNFPTVNDAYFFAGVDIAESKRYNIIRKVKEEYNIELTIIDLNQLSQLLSNTKNYNIAEEYLKIPSDFYPRPEEDEWYSTLKEKYIKVSVISTSDFREVISALRETTSNKQLKIDAKFWISKIEEFYNNCDDFYLKQRALYEIAHSYLRGLNDVKKFKNVFIKYVETYTDTDNLIIIEDAVCILNYAIGTLGKNVVYPKGFISSFYNKLNNKVILLLDQASDINRARLIFLKLLLSIKLILDENFSHNTIIDLIDTLIKELEEHPFYSASKIYESIQLFFKSPANNLINISSEQICNFQDRLDDIISKQEGNGALGDKIKKRMVDFYQQKNYWNAIREGHKLKKVWGQHDAYYGCVLTLAILGDCYEKVGLYYAAKYYYLVSIRMCILSDNLNLYSEAMHPIYSLAKLDYLLGNWYSFLNLLDIYFSLYYLTERKELDLNNEENQELVFYACVIKNLASFDSKYDNLISKTINNLECDEDLKHNILSELQETSPYKTLDELWRELQKSIINRPFNDINPDITIDFNTSGIEWIIKFQNKNNIRIIVEEFIAILQILLGEMRDTDILHIRSTVILNIMETDKNMFEVSELGNNEHFEYDVKIPNYNKKIIIDDFISQILSCTYTIIEKCSLLDEKKLMGILENLFKNDIISRLFFLSSYRNSYKTLYNTKNNTDIIRLEPISKNKKYTFNTEIINLFVYGELSSKLNEEKIKNIIEKRYENSYKFMNSTLDILKEDENFVNLVKDLKKQGYLDWQILMAFSNILLEYKAKKEILESNLLLLKNQETDLLQTKMIDIMNNIEKYNGVVDNINIFFDRDALNIHLDMNYMIELKRLGLQSKSQTPKFSAIKDFLNTRYKYNKIDVPHKELID